MRKLPVLFFLPVLLLYPVVFCSCTSQTQQNNNPGKIPIAVSILPQQYFVERIAGERAATAVMIPPGHNPATYEPTPQQLQALSEAKIYFRIGHIPFEKRWMSSFSSLNPGLRVIDTSEGVTLISYSPSSGHEEETEPHRQLSSEEKPVEEPAGEGHHHSGIDPHIWLSPQAVKIQAGHIRDALSTFDPAGRELYESNYRAFVSDIELLEKDMTAILAGLRGKKFLVFHPAWGYLARDFGLEQIAIEVEGKEPGPAYLKKVIDLARQENIRVIFVQSQFSTHSASAAASEFGGQIVQLDPLSPAWLDNMKKMAEAFRDAASAAGKEK